MKYINYFNWYRDRVQGTVKDKIYIFTIIIVVQGQNRPIFSIHTDSVYALVLSTSRIGWIGFRKKWLLKFWVMCTLENVVNGETGSLGVIDTSDQWLAMAPYFVYLRHRWSAWRQTRNTTSCDSCVVVYRTPLYQHLRLYYFTSTNLLLRFCLQITTFLIFHICPTGFLDWTSLIQSVPCVSSCNAVCCSLSTYNRIVGSGYLLRVPCGCVLYHCIIACHRRML